jgi:thiol:disulfide interchange protein DsbC
LKVTTICVVFALLVLSVFSGTSHSASLPVKPEVSLKQAFPQLQFEYLEPSDIPGWYEVISGTTIYYYNQDRQYLMVGDIYSSKGKNLTADKRGELSAKLVKSLPLDKAVKVGNGKKVVIEFTDPDCPYCKRLSQFFSKRDDITRYVFFAPLAHPQAITKIQYILASDDKEKAYKQMMLDASPPQVNANYSEAVKSLAQEHMNIARKIGIQGTPTAYINGKQVVGADTDMIEKLLKD